MVNHTELIIIELASFYADLYKPCDDYTDEALQGYLDTVSLPALTRRASMELEAPFMLDELKEAAASFLTCKVPGDDGIPMEVYTQYGEVILPKLLKVFNYSFKSGQLPITMKRANIILLLKPGKDPVDPSSYRPISLLQSDVKILAKVLAMRVNKVILSIIHPDQAGFMPRKSTVTNLRRLYVPYH